MTTWIDNGGGDQHALLSESSDGQDFQAGPYLGVLKINPPEVFPSLSGAGLCISIAVDNGGPGGQARIIFGFNTGVGSGQTIRIPSNWPSVRSIAGHWIAAFSIVVP